MLMYKYTTELPPLKHPRGYGTQHIIAVCPECGCVSLECGWNKGECNFEVSKSIVWRDCTNGSLLVKQPNHFGIKGGLK